VHSFGFWHFGLGFVHSWACELAGGGNSLRGYYKLQAMKKWNYAPLSSIVHYFRLNFSIELLIFFVCYNQLWVSGQAKRCVHHVTLGKSYTKTILLLILHRLSLRLCGSPMKTRKTIMVISALPSDE
jgi:hypothetical protein